MSSTWRPTLPGDPHAHRCERRPQRGCVGEGDHLVAVGRRGVRVAAACRRRRPSSRASGRCARPPGRTPRDRACPPRRARPRSRCRRAVRSTRRHPGPAGRSRRTSSTTRTAGSRPPSARRAARAHRGSHRAPSRSTGPRVPRRGCDARSGGGRRRARRSSRRTVGPDRNARSRRASTRRRGTPPSRRDRRRASGTGGAGPSRRGRRRSRRSSASISRRVGHAITRRLKKWMAIDPQPAVAAMSTRVHGPQRHVLRRGQRGAEALAHVHERVDQHRDLQPGDRLQRLPRVVDAAEERHRHDDHAEQDRHRARVGRSCRT